MSLWEYKVITSGRGGLAAGRRDSGDQPSPSEKRRGGGEAHRKDRVEKDLAARLESTRLSLRRGGRDVCAGGEFLKRLVGKGAVSP